MNEKLKKRLMLAVDIFNWTVFSALVLVVIYYGNWMFVSDRFIILIPPAPDECANTRPGR